MTDSELVSLLTQAKNDAAIYTGEFMRENTKYLEAYLGQKTGDFSATPNQSSVVSMDVQDVVEADMPSLARIFLGSGDVVTFQPNTENPVEIQEAEEKTVYVNWLVRNQPESFNIIHNWLKDAEIQKNGVVKYFIEDVKDVEVVEYEGVNQLELNEIIESLKGSKIDKVKIDVIEQEEIELDEGNEFAETEFNVKFRVTTEKQKVRIINIPPESFLITRNATSLDEAEVVGDRVRKTRGELMAEGFPKDLIDDLPKVTRDEVQQSNIKSVRDRDQNGYYSDQSINEWASEYVEILDLYAKIDYDGDGIAERRHVMISGNHVLINEYFNHVPYASLSAILMPHKAIGRSRAEITYQTQLQKTALVRGMNDNIYMVNNPRNVVHPDVDLDDMLTVRTNGIVRLDDDTTITPQQAVMPLQIPYIGDRTLQVIQYVDQARAQTTGTLLGAQGLDADTIAKETATRFNGVEKAGTAKIELIARNYAETGFRKLYEGIAWLVSRYQNTQAEIYVLGKQLTVDPSKWKFNNYVQSTVGLGAGNNEQLVQSLQGIYQIQAQLIQAGSTLADEQDMYNTLKRITDGLGFPRVDEFFNNPEEPDEQLKAQNEILNKMVVQLQAQLQQAQNPLAEAEAIKREGDIAIAQGNLALKQAQLAEEQRQFNVKAAQDAVKQQEDTALSLTEMELKYDTDVPGAIV